MNGVVAADTNVLVRFFTKDDARQFTLSVNLFANHQVFIPETVILETEWVLRFVYEFSSDQICEGFRKLFGLESVVLPNTEKIAEIIEWYEAGMDFADAFHLSNAKHLTSMKTFDKKFIKRAKGKCSCQVELPS